MASLTFLLKHDIIQFICDNFTPNFTPYFTSIYLFILYSFLLVFN